MSDEKLTEKSLDNKIEHQQYPIAVTETTQEMSSPEFNEHAGNAGEYNELDQDAAQTPNSSELDKPALLKQDLPEIEHDLVETSQEAAPLEPSEVAVTQETSESAPDTAPTIEPLQETSLSELDEITMLSPESAEQSIDEVSSAEPAQSAFSPEMVEAIPAVEKITEPELATTIITKPVQDDPSPETDKTSITTLEPLEPDLNILTNLETTEESSATAIDETTITQSFQELPQEPEDTPVAELELTEPEPDIETVTITKTLENTPLATVAELDTTIIMEPVQDDPSSETVGTSITTEEPLEPDLNILTNLETTEESSTTTIDETTLAQSFQELPQEPEDTPIAELELTEPEPDIETVTMTETLEDTPLATATEIIAEIQEPSEPSIDTMIEPHDSITPDLGDIPIQESPEPAMDELPEPSQEPNEPAEIPSINETIEPEIETKPSFEPVQEVFAPDLTENSVVDEALVPQEPASSITTDTALGTISPESAEIPPTETATPSQSAETTGTRPALGGRIQLFLQNILQLLPFAKASLPEYIKKKPLSFAGKLSLLARISSALNRLAGPILNFVTKPAAPEETPKPPAKNSKIIIVTTMIFLFLAVFAGAYMGIKNTSAPPERTPLEILADRGLPFSPTKFVEYAGRGNTHIVRLFLDAGMKPDAIRLFDGYTPLIAAAEYGRIDIVQLLLTEKAKVTTRDKLGQTALMKASANGHVEAVRLLLNYGAEINDKDRANNTALKLAEAKKHTKVVDLLKASGAKDAESLSNPAKPSTQNSQPTNQSLSQTPSQSPTNKPFSISSGQAGPVKVGAAFDTALDKRIMDNMTVGKSYLSDKFQPAANIYVNGRQSPSLIVNLSRTKNNVVTSVDIYDDRFKTAEGVGVNSTLGDLRKHYRLSNAHYNDGSVYIPVRELRMNFVVELTVNSLPTEWLKNGEFQSLPDDMKIQRITVF